MANPHIKRTPIRVLHTSDIVNGSPKKPLAWVSQADYAKWLIDNDQLLQDIIAASGDLSLTPAMVADTFITQDLEVGIMQGEFAICNRAGKETIFTANDQHFVIEFSSGSIVNISDGITYADIANETLKINAGKGLTFIDNPDFTTDPTNPKNTKLLTLDLTIKNLPSGNTVNIWNIYNSQSTEVIGSINIAGVQLPSNGGTTVLVNGVTVPVLSGKPLTNLVLERGFRAKRSGFCYFPNLGTSYMGTLASRSKIMIQGQSAAPDSYEITTPIAYLGTPDDANTGTSYLGYYEFHKGVPIPYIDPIITAGKLINDPSSSLLGTNYVRPYVTIYKDKEGLEVINNQVVFATGTVSSTIYGGTLSFVDRLIFGIVTDPSLLLLNPQWLITGSPTCTLLSTQFLGGSSLSGKTATITTTISQPNAFIAFRSNFTLPTRIQPNTGEPDQNFISYFKYMDLFTDSNGNQIYSTTYVDVLMPSGLTDRFMIVLNVAPAAYNPPKTITIR